MPDSSTQGSHAQTVVVEAGDFRFETVEQESGRATVIRFQLHNPNIRLGDTLLVLSGGEVQFHGMIREVGNGWGKAMDRQGSLLPAAVH